MTDRQQDSLLELPMMRNSKKAFTLIELLVVIAIIALLLSILLPSLRKAKQAAQSVVCRSHEKGIGNALTAYCSAYKEWIPGPSTSGAQVANTGPQQGSTAPFQNVDWISPLLGNELGLEVNPTDRLISILNTKLKCPSNHTKYDYAYPNTTFVVDPKTLSYSSYSAILAFHMFPSMGKGQNSVIQGNLKVITDWEVYNAFNISPGYAPKSTCIGSPSRKIFATEGARYYDPLKGTSFNDFPYQDEGGNFMLFGPAYKRTGDPYELDRTDLNNLKLMPIAKQLAYRHNERLAVIFFDGHCETMDFKESLRANYFFPKDTLITPAGKFSLQDPFAPGGYIR